MPKIKIFNSSSKIPSEIPVINLANNNDYFNNKRQSQTKDKHLEEELKLFAYYKYFSQWEHFSENGTGDILANFGEDNIKLPMTFGHISQALDYLLKPVES